ncbi:MAG: MMPL family transporter, partial [Geminicoccaceae bacterium]
MSLVVHRAMIWWVERIAARPGLVVLAMTLAALGALDYTARNLKIHTETTDMISADVPFRRNEIAFREAFPQFTEPLVAVIQAKTPERADRAARALALALEADREHFVAVDLPEGGPFLVRHALLYQDAPDLGALVDRLSAAQPLLAVLAEDPSLRGIARFVALALEGAPDADALPPELDRLLGAMAETTEAMLAGRPGDFSWQSLLGGEDAAPTLRLVRAQPKLAFDTMAPAGAAIEALRRHARALGI